MSSHDNDNSHSTQIRQILERINDNSPTVNLSLAQKRALLIVGLTAVGLALIFLISAQAKPDVVAVKALPSQTSNATEVISTLLVVDVQGEVVHPGVYQLPGGSRVGDAIKAAGGVKKGSTSTSVNLARFLEDGEQIYVAENGYLGEFQSSAAPTGGASRGRLHLNRATEGELDALPGVGPVLAKRIIAYRTENGSFGSINDLQKVSGIGPAKFNELRDFITV